MSETEKATARAQGALADFLTQMSSELERKDRSPEYCAEFWAALRAEMSYSLELTA